MLITSVVLLLVSHAGPNNKSNPCLPDLGATGGHIHSLPADCATNAHQQYQATVIQNPVELYLPEVMTVIT